MKFKPFCSLLKATATDWWNDNPFRLAAALAFYTIFSLAPIIIIAIGLAGIFYGQERATREVVGELESFVGPQAGAAFGEMSTVMLDRESGLRAVIIGAITVVVGSTVFFAELQSVLNQIWDVQVRPERGIFRGLFRDRAQSFGLALLVGFLLLASMVVSAMISGAAAYLAEYPPDIPRLWSLVEIAVSFIIIAILFALIYKYLPDVKITWGDVAIGSVVTASLFTIGKYSISMYLGRMAVASTYGAAGSFVLFLLWVYYSALIYLFGAEFTQVYARRHGSGIHPRSYAMRKRARPDVV
jgi:membrane protein